MHAYLIMAHTNVEQLGSLISALDHPSNDIYIHLDRKMGDVDLEFLKQKAKKSKIVFTKRLNVIWGHYSQIECEMELFKTALLYKKYEYLHLLSGMDLPLCSQDYMHEFFNSDSKIEYVHIESEDLTEKDKEKCNYRFPIQKYIGNRTSGILYYTQRILVRMQKYLGLKKDTRPFDKLYKGANWVSVTGDFAKYLIEQEKIIEKVFKYSKCCDEIFLQTILMNSPFSKCLSSQVFCDDYRMCQRYIDWERGNPYVFRDSDFDELIKSGYLFARKFDIKVDSVVIERIVSFVKGGNNG